MKDWLFTYSKDQSSVKVDLPHTWNNLDGQDGGNDYYRGTCFYTKDVNKPNFNDDQLVYLQFHGVNASAKVYFNEELVCMHDGGYSTFRVDVTKYLNREQYTWREREREICCI